MPSTEQSRPGGRSRPGRSGRLRSAAGWAVGVVLLPLALLALAEAGLRAAGVGEDTRPFLRVVTREGALHAPNKAFYDQFLTDPQPGGGWLRQAAAVPGDKAPGVFRVFVFGGSAAQGWPAEEYAFPGMLHAMLDSSFPEARVEVFNFARSSMNSHVMREVAEACARLRPDAFLVYMGNNEFHGPFGALSEFRTADRVPSAAAARAAIRLNRLRIFQLLKGLRAPADTGQTGLFRLPPRPAAPVGPPAEQVRENFRANLSAICRAARAAGAPVFLSTVAVNLRDWPPQDTGPPAGLSGEALDTWKMLLAKGRARLRASDAAGAEALLQEAAGITGRHGELQFLLGRCAWAGGDFARAREHFLAALDLDAYLWARCRPELERVIRETAAGEGAALVDAGAAVAAASPGGIPGAELIPDACHPDFSGSFLIARAFYDALAPLVARRAGAGPDTVPAPPSEETCAGWMGHTPAERARVLREIINRVQSLNKGEATAAASARLEALEREIGGGAGAPAELAACRAAADQCANHPHILLRLAAALREEGLPEEALDRVQAFVAAHPGHRDARQLLGRLLEGQGRPQEALAVFSDLCRLFPDSPDAVLGLAGLHLRLGRPEETLRTVSAAARRMKRLAWQDPAKALLRTVEGEALLALHRPGEALEAFRAARELHPGARGAWVGEGRVLEAAGDTQGAAAAYLKELEANPAATEPHRELDRMLAGMGDAASWVTLWEEFTGRHPGRGDAWLRLALARERAEDPKGALEACQKALDLVPPAEGGAVQPVLGRLLGAQAEALLAAGAPEEALALYRTGAARLPGFGFSLGEGRALERLGRREEAVAAYRRAVEEAPEAHAAHAELERALLALGRPAGLEAILEEIAEALPEARRVWLHLGLARERLGDSDGAVAALERAATADGDGNTPQEAPAALARVLAARGTARLDAGRAAEALEDFRRAGGLDPRAPGAKTGEALALEALGEMEGALAAAREAVDLTPEEYAPYAFLDRVHAARGELALLETLWTAMTEADPARRHAWFCLALARERAGNPQGALEACQQAMDLASPEESAAMLPVLGRLLAAQAEALLAAGDAGEALALYRTGVARLPGFGFSLGEGRALERLGRREEAVAAYRRAVEEAPEAHAAHAELERALLDAGRPADLEAILEEIAAALPEARRVWLHLGGARERLGDSDGAVAALERAAAADGDGNTLPEAPAALARVLAARGTARLDAGLAAEALEDFRRAVKADPRAPGAKTGEARALEALGDMEGALAAAREATDLTPEDYAAYAFLDRVHAARGELALLETLWTGMTAADPARRHAWFCLGLALERQKRRGEAAAAYERAAALAPEGQAGPAREAAARAAQAAR